jgi:hypothetical protein
VQSAPAFFRYDLRLWTAVAFARFDWIADVRRRERRRIAGRERLDGSLVDRILLLVRGGVRQLSWSWVARLPCWLSICGISHRTSKE